VYELSGLADYQTGGIVSRTLTNSKAGSLTLFVFDEGQRLSEHTSPYDAFVHVIDGTAEVLIDGVALDIEAGRMVLMPANVPHAVNARQKFTMLLTMFKSKQD
jgi:quercetin dioxygenase-like cupin family protein